MAVQGRVIKNKITSVQNIRKITKTMEMVSVAKMRRAVDRATSSKEFTRESYEMLATIASRYAIGEHVFFTKPEQSEKILLVIVSSQKGMCGGYNANVSKKVKLFVEQNTDTVIEVITIGKQSEKIARRLSLPIIASFTHFSETVTSDESAGLAKVLLENFSSQEFSGVTIIATEFVKAMQYQVQEIPLLPITLELSKKYSAGETTLYDAGNYLLEPSVEHIVEYIVPKLLNAIVFQVLLDAFASEHSARMVAMKNATDNAGELLGELKITFNKARQEAITQELSEIVAGASALQ